MKRSRLRSRLNPLRRRGEEDGPARRPFLCEGRHGRWNGPGWRPPRLESITWAAARRDTPIYATNGSTLTLEARPSRLNSLFMNASNSLRSIVSTSRSRSVRDMSTDW